MRARKFGAAMGALVAVVSGIVVGGGTVAQAAPGCPSLYVVAIPGTWETSDKPDHRPTPGMLAGVTNGLSSNVRADYVTYAATAFPWEGDVYGRSKNEAESNARGMIKAMADQCGATKIALVGYSQGADAAGDIAAEIGTGVGIVSPNRIAAVGLLSDPRRSPTDAQVGPYVPGAGAGGARVGGFGFVSAQTRTICAAGDLYCSTPSDDFVTRMAGFLAQTSDPNPANFLRYQEEGSALWNDLNAHGGIPQLQSQLSDQANQQRTKKLEQFYGSTVHTDYWHYSVDSSGTSAVQWMHNWIQSVA